MFQTRSLSRVAALLVTGALLGAAPARAQSPSDSVVVMHFDVAGLMQSELYKALVAKFPDKMDNKDPKYLEFKEATGINLETDIKNVTIGVAGDLGGTANKFYAILDGKFDAAKIEGFAKASGKATLGQAAGLTTFTPTENEGGGPIPTFAVLDANTMIIASQEEFAALAASAKTGGVPTAPAIGKVFQKDAKGQVHIAVVLPASTKEQLKGNPQAAPFATVETVLLSADVGADVVVSLKVAADSEVNGKGVYDALNGFVAIGKMMSAEQPAAQTIMNGLKLEQAGAATVLSLNVKSADIMALVEQSMAGAGGSGPSTAPAADGAEGGEGDEGGEEEVPAAATPSP